MEHDNTYIRFDWAIKHILRDKSNFGILEGLISVLLNEKVEIVELLESESNQDFGSVKFNQVDILAKNCKGRLVIVKVQLVRRLFYLERIVSGICDVTTGYSHLDFPYINMVEKVYSITILYCNFGKGDDYVYHGETRFKGIHTGNDLYVNVKEEGVIVPHLPLEVFPEYYLVRLNAYDKIPDTPLDEWLTYLKTGKVREDTHAPGLQEVKRKLQIPSMTVRELRSYEEHMDTLRYQEDVLDTAYEEGRAEGLTKEARELAEGRAEGIVQVARNLISLGMDNVTIRNATGLSDREVEAIRNEAP